MGLGGTLLSVLRASCHLSVSRGCQRCYLAVLFGCSLSYGWVLVGSYCDPCWDFGCCMVRAGLWSLVSGSVYSCSLHAAVLYLGCRRFSIVEAGTRFLNLKKSSTLPEWILVNSLGFVYQSSHLMKPHHPKFLHHPFASQRFNFCSYEILEP
jgi:hypothetical protein